MSLPVRHAFSATSPRVAHNQFHQFHGEAFRLMIGRSPTAFERATADTLYQSYISMPKGKTAHAFKALSAATGAGKTTSACALMVYLQRSQGLACAYVVSTLAVAEEVHKHLTALTTNTRSIREPLSHCAEMLPVAAYTSVHKVNASPRTLDQYAEQKVIPSAQYTEDQFRKARIVVTTHERWRHELASGLDLGVLKCNGNDRALVVVDEEPELDYSVVRQPEDISALASLLADVELKSEARVYGLAQTHYIAPTLLDIHERMREVKDGALGHHLQSAELVTAVDLQSLAEVTTQDLTARVAVLGVSDQTDTMAYHRGTLEFLRLAGQGRVFYSKDEGGAFYAYGFPVEPRPRHLILDGTADLNGMYAVGKHVAVVSAVAADYSQVRLHAVQPPQQFKGRMRGAGVLRNDSEVHDYLTWFMPFLIEQTRPGQEVLVYCKKQLLTYGVHKLAQFDDSGQRRERFLTSLQGRVINWCHFGRGRGLNQWKHCTAYFRLGDFVMKRAVVMSRIASTTGEKYTTADLKRLNSGALRDPRVQQAQAAHLATTNKQDAARICIRHLDDDGRAATADLYMVDCDLATLVSYRTRMFPGAGEYRVLTCNDEGTSMGGTIVAPRQGAASRIANLLLTTELSRFTVADLQARCGLRPKDYTRTINTAEVQAAMLARGWYETTRRAIGLSGKGKLLIRST